MTGKNSHVEGMAVSSSDMKGEHSSRAAGSSAQGEEGRGLDVTELVAWVGMRRGERRVQMAVVMAVVMMAVVVMAVVMMAVVMMAVVMMAVVVIAALVMAALVMAALAMAAGELHMLSLRDVRTLPFRGLAALHEEVGAYERSVAADNHAALTHRAFQPGNPSSSCTSSGLARIQEIACNRHSGNCCMRHA